MASSKGDEPRKKGSMPSGVRGPGGPPPVGASGRGSQPRPNLPSGASAPSPARQRFEEMSYGPLRTLHAMPRWIIVIAPAILLFGGLILTGPLSWLGGILLLLVWAFIAWLTALSWPALSPGSRAFRALVVFALLGIVIWKFLGRI